MRHKSPFTLYKRGEVWYVTRYVKGKRVIVSTGETSIVRARQYAVDILKSGKTSTPSFSEYAEPFFQWDRCPHVRRLRDEGKEITQRWCDHQRGWLEKYVIGEKRIRARYDELKATVKWGEIKLALDMAVVQRDTAETQTVGA